MKLILNADDFGRTETVNRSITYGFDNGYLDRTTIMVNMPFFDQAVKMAEEHNFKNRVGLHINLTTGMPLTDEIKKFNTFCTEKGNFNGYIFYSKRMMLFLTKEERRVAQQEIEAQIKKYIGAGFDLLHADSHGHVHTFPSLQKIILKKLKFNKFHSVRIAANLHATGCKKVWKYIQNMKLVAFNSKSLGKDFWFCSLNDFLARREWVVKQKGICEIMLHPNIFDGDMQIGQGKHYSDIDVFRGITNNE